MLKEFFRRKRWRYLAIQNENFFIATAVVDTGYSGLCFYYVFDKRQGRILVDRSMLKLPGAVLSVGDTAEAGASTVFRQGSSLFRFQENDGQYFIELSRNQEISLHLRTASFTQGHAVSVKGPTVPSGEHWTVKSSVIPVEEGALMLAGRSEDLKGAWVTQDYSNGLLPRSTKWLWASAHALDQGFNLQQGYFQNAENYFWHQGAAFPVGPAHFVQTPQWWEVKSPADRFFLRFSPLAERREDKNFLLVRSQYAQPLGLFSGWYKTPDGIKHEFRDLFGVTEDHKSLW